METSSNPATAPNEALKEAEKPAEDATVSVTSSQNNNSKSLASALPADFRAGADLPPPVASNNLHRCVPGRLSRRPG